MLQSANSQRRLAICGKLEISTSLLDESRLRGMTIFWAVGGRGRAKNRQQCHWLMETFPFFLPFLLSTGSASTYKISMNERPVCMCGNFTDP
jgi:hypothetical protein